MEGTFTALITPFKDGDLDERGLRENVQFQLREGIEGLLALGSTGESEALSDGERRRVIQIVCSEAKEKVPVFIQTGDSATYRAIQKTAEAKSLGADGVLIVAPYYCCPTQEGLFCHYEAIARSTTLPILLYNHPKRTGVRFELETLRRLALIENIVGLKDASGDVAFCAQVLNTTEDFILFSGDDLLTLPLMSIGSKGSISVMSNLMPKEISDLGRQLNLEKYQELFPLFLLSQCESNPIPIKAMMHARGMASGQCRLPLTPLSKENQDKMETLLFAYA